VRNKFIFEKGDAYNNNNNSYFALNFLKATSERNIKNNYKNSLKIFLPLRGFFGVKGEKSGTF